MHGPRLGLDLRVPWQVWAALAFFFAVNFTCILNARGVFDPEGYTLNTSKNFKVNVYDDDGTVSLFHAMGYYNGVYDTFSIATNFGGPLLHAAKPVMRITAWLGLYQRFDDPTMYTLYPGELARAWKVFGTFKLVLLLGLPLAMYYLGVNFVSRGAGLLACWLTALIPAIPGFEMRMKPDGVVLMLALYVLLLLLEHMRSGRARHLYLAGAVMGAAFAMKFTMAVVAPLYLWCGVYGAYARTGTISRACLMLMGKSLAVCGVVFALANPLLLCNPGIFLSFIGRYTSIAQNPDLPQSLWHTAFFRLSHFEPFHGWLLNLAAWPTLAWHAVRTVRHRLVPDAQTLVFALFVGNVFYLWKIAHNHLVLNITYYYYGQSILLVFLEACALAGAWRLLRERLGARAVLAALAAVFFASAAGEQLKVVRFLCGPSTRQEVHAWIQDNVPAGASVGYQANPGAHVQFLERVMLNPFTHAMIPVGRSGAQLGQRLPDYLLWVRQDTLTPLPRDPRYELVAEFDSGKFLPRETFSFYQDDHYQVLRRTAPASTPPQPAPNAAELLLASALKDAPGKFSVLQYRALGQYPLAVTLVGRTPAGFFPLPGAAFTAAYRPQGPAVGPGPAGGVAYVHQLGPEALAFWGVRYVMALADDSFAANVAADARFALRPTGRTAQTPAGTAVLYENTSYAGQALFLPDPPAEAAHRQEARYKGLLERHRLKPYGALYPAALMERHKPAMLRVRMAIHATGRMDLLLKAGRVQSVILAPGANEVDLPLDVGGAGEVGYEINPVDPGAVCSVYATEASPLRVVPVQESASMGLGGGFARVQAEGPGTLTMAAPFDPYWTAEANNQTRPCLPGPAGTTAVRLDAGDQLVRLWRAR